MAECQTRSTRRLCGSTVCPAVVTPVAEALLPSSVPLQHKQHSAKESQRCAVYKHSIISLSKWTLQQHGLHTLIPQTKGCCNRRTGRRVKLTTTSGGVQLNVQLKSKRYQKRVQNDCEEKL